MNVVDSSGWLEYFTDGKNADFFKPALLKTSQLIVPTVSIFEVFKKVLKNKNEDLAFQAVAVMKQGNVIDLTLNISLEAAKLSVDLSLPMADSLILATARKHKATLWTQDSDFRGLSKIKYINKKS